MRYFLSIHFLSIILAQECGDDDEVKVRCEGEECNTDSLSAPSTSGPATPTVVTPVATPDATQVTEFSCKSIPGLPEGVEGCGKPGGVEFTFDLDGCDDAKITDFEIGVEGARKVKVTIMTVNGENIQEVGFNLRL